MHKLKPVKKNTNKPGKKLQYNDKGEKVPDKCPKCGSKIGVYLQGEPIFRCTNNDCKKFFGVVGFPDDE